MYGRILFALALLFASVPQVGCGTFTAQKCQVCCMQSASPLTLPSLLYEVHVFNEKKQQCLVHARVIKALPQSRGGGGDYHNNKDH